MYKNGVWQKLTESSKKSILKRLKRLWNQVYQYLTKKEWRKVMASLTFLIGTGTSLNAQIFDPLWENPFGLTGLTDNTFNMVKTVDIDGDGDFDLIGSNYNYLTSSTTYFFTENIGSNTNPEFTTPVKDPFGLTPSISLIQVSAIVDLDNDGDFDIIATSYGDPDPILYYENTGTKTNPKFANPSLDPFNFNSNFNFGLPTLAAGDIDDDGDLDIIFFSYYYGSLFFENDGTPSSPNFKEPVTNPFSIIPPTADFFGTEFTDLDQDGDLDILLNVDRKGVVFFENTGSSSSPKFSSPVFNPFGLKDLDGTSPVSVSTVDLDDDGDVDLLFTDLSYDYDNYTYTSNYFYFQNRESVGIKENEKTSTLTIYPQPSKNFLTIDLSGSMGGDFTIKIYDITGKTLMYKIVDGAGSHDIMLDNLEAGTYIVDVTGTSYYATSRFIKQ